MSLAMKYGGATMKRWTGVFALAMLALPTIVFAQQRTPPLVSPQVDADRKITFRLRAPKAEKVALASGELQATLGKLPEMTKDSNGVWSVTIGPVPPGIYDYDF